MAYGGASASVNRFFALRRCWYGASRAGNTRVAPRAGDRRRMLVHGMPHARARRATANTSARAACRDCHAGAVCVLGDVASPPGDAARVAVGAAACAAARRRPDGRTRRAALHDGIASRPRRRRRTCVRARPPQRRAVRGSARSPGACRRCRSPTTCSAASGSISSPARRARPPTGATGPIAA